MYSGVTAYHCFCMCITKTQKGQLPLIHHSHHRFFMSTARILDCLHGTITSSISNSINQYDGFILLKEMLFRQTKSGEGRAPGNKTGEPRPQGSPESLTPHRRPSVQPVSAGHSLSGTAPCSGPQGSPRLGNNSRYSDREGNRVHRFVFVSEPSRDAGSFR